MTRTKPGLIESASDRTPDDGLRLRVIDAQQTVDKVPGRRIRSALWKPSSAQDGGWTSWWCYDRRRPSISDPERDDRAGVNGQYRGLRTSMRGLTRQRSWRGRGTWPAHAGQRPGLGSVAERTNRRKARVRISPMTLGVPASFGAARIGEA